MRLTILLPILFAAPLWCAPALAADPPPAGGLELEICRLPGVPSEYSGREIDIPAGVAFSQASGLDDVAAPQPAAPPIRVTLAAPAAIPASAFCVRAPIRPADPAQDHALHARVGDMFWVTSGMPGMAPGSLDAIYRLLRDKDE